MNTNLNNHIIQKTVSICEYICEKMMNKLVIREMHMQSRYQHPAITYPLEYLSKK